MLKSAVGHFEIYIPAARKRAGSETNGVLVDYRGEASAWRGWSEPETRSFGGVLTRIVKPPCVGFLGVYFLLIELVTADVKMFANCCPKST